MTDRIVVPIPTYDLAVAYTALRSTKKQSQRVKAAVVRLEDALCRFAESIVPTRMGPLDPEMVDKAVTIVKDKLKD